LGVPSLLHFLYKSNAACQYTAPKFEAPYVNRHDKKK